MGASFTVAAFVSLISAAVHYIRRDKMSGTAKTVLAVAFAVLYFAAYITALSVVDREALLNTTPSAVFAVFFGFFGVICAILLALSTALYTVKKRLKEI